MARRPLWSARPVPARAAGGWTVRARRQYPPGVIPVQAFRQQVQTYIGGYGVGSTTTLGQVASNTTSSLTTLTVTLSKATTAGNCLVCCLTSGASTDSPTISGITLGGVADNWAAAASGGGGAGVEYAAIWIDPNCKGGQTSVVITLTGGSGSGGVGAYVFEVPSLLTSPLDAAPAGVTGSGTAFTTNATGTLAQPSEIAFAVVGAPSGAAPIIPPGSPWQEQTAIGVAGFLTMTAAYQVVTTAGSLIYNGTLAASSTWAACIITLKISPLGVTLGGAQLSLGPGYLTRWYPNQVNVATAAGASDTATCTGYLNVIGQGGFLFQSYAGGGDQIGLAVPEMLPGDLMHILWTGSKPGIAAQAVLIGTQAVPSL
jgi:hypothetical protein